MLNKCVLICLVSTLSLTYPINVKIVKDIESHNSNQNDIRTAKTNASNFSGPSDLLYLVGKCFPFSDNKYEYKVCPFDNITQHEKVWHSGAFNAIIGVWKEWSVLNNSFDSLVFTDGDDCEEKVQRNAKLIWICNRDVNQSFDAVIDIKEPKKCFYEIHFASDFGCDSENKYIYRHLTEDKRLKWDRIETEYHFEELTQFGYESALKQLFVESGIVLKTSEDFNSNETEGNCSQNFVKLLIENKELKNRIEILEKQLNKN